MRAVLLAVLLAVSAAPAWGAFCSGYNTCASCTGDLNCGWCGSSGTCMTGTISGPTYVTCNHQSDTWQYSSSQCLTPMYDYCTDPSSADCTRCKTYCQWQDSDCKDVFPVKVTFCKYYDYSHDCLCFRNQLTAGGIAFVVCLVLGAILVGVAICICIRRRRRAAAVATGSAVYYAPVQQQQYMYQPPMPYGQQPQQQYPYSQQPPMQYQQYQPYQPQPPPQQQPAADAGGISAFPGSHLRAQSPPPQQLQQPYGAQPYGATTSPPPQQQQARPPVGGNGYAPLN